MSEKGNKSIEGSVSVTQDAIIGGDATVRGDATVGHDLIVEGWLVAKNIRGTSDGGVEIDLGGYYIEQLAVIKSDVKELKTTVNLQGNTIFNHEDALSQHEQKINDLTDIQSSHSRQLIKLNKKVFPPPGIEYDKYKDSNIWEVLDSCYVDVSSVKGSLSGLDKKLDGKVTEALDSKLVDFNATVKDKIETELSSRLASLNTQIDGKIATTVATEVANSVETEVAAQLTESINTIVDERVNAIVNEKVSAALASETAKYEARLTKIEQKLEIQQQTSANDSENT